MAGGKMKQEGVHPGSIKEQFSLWAMGRQYRTHLGMSQQRKLGVHPQSCPSLAGVLLAV